MMNIIIIIITKTILTNFLLRLRIKCRVDAFNPTWQALGALPQRVQNVIQLIGSMAVQQSPRRQLAVAFYICVVNAAHVVYKQFAVQSFGN